MISFSGNRLRPRLSIAPPGPSEGPALDRQSSLPGYGRRRMFRGAHELRVDQVHPLLFLFVSQLHAAVTHDRRGGGREVADREALPLASRARQDVVLPPPAAADQGS